MVRPVSVFRYGACVGSWDRVARWVAPAAGGAEFIGLAGQPSLAVAYNRILDLFAADHDGPVVLLHDDLEIVDPAFETKAFAVLADQPDVALVGVAGGVREDAGLAWWEGPTIGHQTTDAAMLDFGQRTGEVAVLEGSVLVFSPWAVRNLRYDTAYRGFYSADTVALPARRAGKRLWVADIGTHHHTPMGFRTPASAEAWGAGAALYREQLAAWRQETEVAA